MIYTKVGAGCIHLSVILPNNLSITSYSSSQQAKSWSKIRPFVANSQGKYDQKPRRHQTRVTGFQASQNSYSASLCFLVRNTRFAHLLTFRLSDSAQLQTIATIVCVDQMCGRPLVQFVRALSFSPFLPQSAQRSLPSSLLSARMALLFGESEVDMSSCKQLGCPAYSSCIFNISGRLRRNLCLQNPIKKTKPLLLSTRVN